jgi:hypothetical protein
MKKEIMYTHENIDSRLTIKRTNENVVTVNLIDKPKQLNIHWQLVYQTAITTIEKLTKIN